MKYVVSVPLNDAESVRSELLEQGLIDFSRLPLRDKNRFYIPVIHELEDYVMVDKELPEKADEPSDLREALSEELNEQELHMLKTAYDLVGDIAIIEIDEELRHKQTLIANTLLELHSSINVVVRKQGSHSGEFRLQEYVHLAGEKRFETEAVENGCRLRLDIRKTYYSVRSATERKRVAELVNDGEKVLVMFSGIGPFVCAIAKMSGASEVVGVELNEDAHQYAEENIEINKLTNAKVIQGDVREVVPNLETFDRLLMPLPHTAEDFLDVAVPACKNNGIIHLYHFATEEEIESFAGVIHDRLEKLSRKGDVVNIQRCGNLAPGIHRWTLDIKVT